MSMILGRFDLVTIVRVDMQENAFRGENFHPVFFQRLEGRKQLVEEGEDSRFKIELS